MQERIGVHCPRVLDNLMKFLLEEEYDDDAEIKD
jgi:hypothetical protein